MIGTSNRLLTLHVCSNLPLLYAILAEREDEAIRPIGTYLFRHCSNPEY